MRIMTYNIQHGIDYTADHWVCNLDLSLDIVKKFNPEICAFNEIFGDGDGGEFFNQPKYIADNTNYECIFSQAADFGKNRRYGNALATKFPIKNVENFNIPQSDDPNDPAYKEPRAILKTILDCDGKELCVIVTHIGLAEKEKKQAIEKLTELIDNEKRPLILMGDFNMTPDNPLLTPIFERMYDTAKLFTKELFSFPSDNPRQKIDYILTRNLKVSTADIPQIMAADHCPYVAEIEFQ